MLLPSVVQVCFSLSVSPLSALPFGPLSYSVSVFGSRFGSACLCACQFSLGSSSYSDRSLCSWQLGSSSYSQRHVAAMPPSSWGLKCLYDGITNTISRTTNKFKEMELHLTACFERVRKPLHALLSFPISRHLAVTLKNLCGRTLLLQISRTIIWSKTGKTADDANLDFIENFHRNIGPIAL
jgi:hypothetical protein